MRSPTTGSLISIAHEAGAAIQSARRRGLTVTEKQRGEVVTSADLASHDVLVRRFAQAFPDLPLLSEEGNTDFISGPMAVADELDGTSAFSAGSKQWGVMLALVDHGPTQGVIFLPDLEITISAEKGHGCELNGQPITVKADRPISDVLLGTELNNALTASDWQLLQTASGSFRAARCLASAAAAAHELLTGITHAYLNVRGGRIWDFAAIALAVAEAGGTATDPGGRSLEWNEIQMSFLATSGPRLLREFLEIRERAIHHA
jgi:fructose-1,6-bisphosphatase/inositol monophosphatase family enzyme